MINGLSLFCSLVTGNADPLRSRTLEGLAPDDFDANDLRFDGRLIPMTRKEGEANDS
jgi:hypothetical protein